MILSMILFVFRSRSIMANAFQCRENFIYLPRNDQSIVFYFGGDIQDWPERMAMSKENRRYQRWNLLATGEQLAQRFPQSSIVVLRPNEMKDGTFSRFSEFVPNTNEYGDPLTYDVTDLVALRHLHLLNEQLMPSNSSRLTLIGFSKGCVVLNQILHEWSHLRETKKDETLASFVSRIETMIWLDGGHNNGKLAMIWPNELKLISTLKEAKIQTEVYVTPFQINSTNSYKHHHYQHYQTFSQLLASHCEKDRVINQMYFATDPPSIEKHFELLSVF